MKNRKLPLIGKIVGLLTLIIGTWIFISYYLTSNDNLLFIGYAFIIIAGIVNFIMLTALISKNRQGKIEEKYYKQSIWIILSNIPTLIIYCVISFVLLGVIRLTVKNSTDQDLNHIQLVGCENKEIDNLKPGESKTIWIGITGDCSIDIKYTINDSLKTDVVASYVTSGMGQRLNFKIGEKNFIDF